MELLQESQFEVLNDNFDSPSNFRVSEGGNMAYRRVLFDDANGITYFAKAYDPTLLQDEWRREEMIYYLEKEARVYQHLETNGYKYIPSMELYRDNMIVLEGLTEENGWNWRLPRNRELHTTYIADIISALVSLESVDPIELDTDDEVSIDTFYNHGWDKLHNLDAKSLVSNNLDKWKDSLHAETPAHAYTMFNSIDELALKRLDISLGSFNHHDARQSNIAWHKSYGARIVDWSWADKGMEYGDTTMFLMDLHKSDHTDKSFTDNFNPVYAKMMLGYWLQRSHTEHAEGNDRVRLQQFVSAVKASQLVRSLGY